MNKKTMMVNINQQKSPLMQAHQLKTIYVNFHNTRENTVNYYKFLSIIINKDVFSEDLKER